MRFVVRDQAEYESAPGPDGLPYAFREAVPPEAIGALEKAAEAMEHGAPAPAQLRPHAPHAGDAGDVHEDGVQQLGCCREPSCQHRGADEHPPRPLGVEVGDGGDRRWPRQDCARASPPWRSIKENYKLEKQLKEARTAFAAASTSSSGPKGMQAQDFKPLVKIGGFEQETPRGTLEEAWANFIRPVIQARMEIEGMDVCAPDMLSSQLEARFSDFSQAILFLAALRKQDTVLRMNNHEVEIWGALQKPKEVRDRNRRLLRVAEALQQHVAPGVGINKETFKNICWISGTIVIADRRIARDAKEGGSDFKLVWNEHWYDTQFFRGAVAHIESAA